jgi:hypothetical protein
LSDERESAKIYLKDFALGYQIAASKVVEVSPRQARKWEQKRNDDNLQTLRLYSFTSGS